MKSRTGLMVALQLVLLAALALFAATMAHAGNGFVQQHVLFNGSNTDSTEQISDWIPLTQSGAFANEVIIRLWTSKPNSWAAGQSAADSLFADSITTFRMYFSDSVCCSVTGRAGQTIKSAADSVLFDPLTAVPGSGGYTDTTLMLAARPIPVNKELRAAASGSGRYTILMAMSENGLAGSVIAQPSGIIAKRYMRLRVTPLRRSTVKGLTITAGERVTGLKGLKAIAYVWYENKN